MRKALLQMHEIIELLNRTAPGALVGCVLGIRIGLVPYFPIMLTILRSP